MNIFKFIVIATCFIIVSLAAYIAYQHVFPLHVLTSPDKEMKILKKQVRPGEIQSYVINYCKTSNVQGTVIVQLMGEAGSPVLIETKSNAPEKCESSTINVKIPDNATPGIRYIRATSSYQFKYRTVTDPFDTERFEIIQ